MKIGIAADHGGFELRKYLWEKLSEQGYELIDYGNSTYDIHDDYPDYVIPLASAISEKKVDRGIALCGSGVGACVAANRINDVRACLICDTFSAHQGVEDDNMNLICLGGRITGTHLAHEIVTTFLSAHFSGEERHLRRLEKIHSLE
ncbi:MAG: RpiB/LacA/LacB family sugar-phosphate isomerase [Chloroflexota bacterium]